MSTEYTVGFAQMRNIYLESIAPQNLLSEKKKNKKNDNLDPVGKEDADIDNDGDEDKIDDYLINRRKKRSKIIQSKKVNENFIPEFEGYYDWRSTVSEDIQAAIEELDGDQIEEKPVNNYAKGKNGKTVVTINPTINIGEAASSLGGEVLQESELSLDDVIEIATEYFCQEGLNAEGVEMVIEELGSESFSEFVIDLAEDYLLTEGRTLLGKKTNPASGKERGISLKAAPGKTTKDAAQKYGTIRRFPSKSKAPQAIERVKKAQPSLPPAEPTRRELAKQKLAKAAAGEKGTGVRTAPSATRNKDEIRKVVRSGLGAVGDALNLGGQGLSAAWGAHKKAMEARKKGEKIGGQLGAGVNELGRAAKDFFLKKQVKEAIEYLINEGYDISEITLDQLYREIDYLEEKAVSEQQQKLFGAALSVKRGQTSRDEVSKQVLDIVDSMSETEIRKFAKTKHEGIPKVVSEGLTYEDILRYMKR